MQKMVTHHIQKIFHKIIKIISTQNHRGLEVSIQSAKRKIMSIKKSIVLIFDRCFIMCFGEGLLALS